MRGEQEFVHVGNSSVRVVRVCCVDGCVDVVDRVDGGRHHCVRYEGMGPIREI